MRLERVQQPTQMDLLLDELRRLRETMQEQNELIRAQGERIAALEAPSAPSSGANDERDKEVEELHKRIGYLQRELERCSPSPETEERRAWWQVWKR